MQCPQQGLGRLWAPQYIGDLPLGVEDEGFRKTIQSVVVADDSVRVDQVRVGEVVLPDEGASGARPVGPIDAYQPRPPVQRASHALQLWGLLLTRRAPAGPEVDRCGLAAQGCERYLRQNENPRRQLGRGPTGLGPVRCAAQQHDRDQGPDCDQDRQPGAQWATN